MCQLKKILALLCLSGAACAQTDGTDWLNIMGDGEDPAVNTVEVDPTPLGGDERVFKVRVSRSAERVSWDGIRYRSYVSKVRFDCVHNTARYLSIDFYLAPGWKGASHHTSVYTDSPPRFMEFREITPNPAQRIVRAACESSSVSSN